MQELLLVYSLDFHEDTVRLIGAFVLANGKWLTTLGRSLVNNIEF